MHLYILSCEKRNLNFIYFFERGRGNREHHVQFETLTVGLGFTTHLDNRNPSKKKENKETSKKKKKKEEEETSTILKPFEPKLPLDSTSISNTYCDKEKVTTSSSFLLLLSNYNDRKMSSSPPSSSIIFHHHHHPLYYLIDNDENVH